MVAKQVPAGDGSVRRRWFEQAAELAAEDPETIRLVLEVWYGLAIKERTLADLTAIVGLGTSIIERAQHDATTCAIVAACQQALGNGAAAQALYEEAIGLAPDEADYHNNLAYLILSRSGDLVEASRLAQRAIDLSAQDGTPPQKRREFFDTLGLIKLGSGDPGDALTAFEDGIEVDPRAAHLHLGRARSLHALGRDDEALEALDEAERTATIEGRTRSFLEELERLRAEWR